MRPMNPQAIESRCHIPYRFMNLVSPYALIPESRAFCTIVQLKPTLILITSDLRYVILSGRFEYPCNFLSRLRSLVDLNLTDMPSLEPIVGPAPVSS